MGIEEAREELNELRGLAYGGNGLATIKERVAALYWQVCRKKLRDCNCKDIIPDALAEIYYQLNRQDNMAHFNSNARLVNGVVLQHKGNHYTNANLTDEVAREFLEAFPQRADWFAVLPSAVSANHVTVEASEPAAAAEKKAAKASTPKAKKTAKKRK